MKKSDLIKPLLKVLSTKTEAKNAIQTIFNVMKSALKKGDKVVISNFGTFFVRFSTPRKLKIPKKNTYILTHPKKKVKFIPSKNLSKYLEE